MSRVTTFFPPLAWTLSWYQSSGCQTQDDLRTEGVGCRGAVGLLSTGVVADVEVGVSKESLSQSTGCLFPFSHIHCRMCSMHRRRMRPSTSSMWKVRGPFFSLMIPTIHTGPVVEKFFTKIGSSNLNCLSLAFQSWLTIWAPTLLNTRDPRSDSSMSNAVWASVEEVTHQAWNQWLCVVHSYSEIGIWKLGFQYLLVLPSLWHLGMVQR